MPDPAPSPTSDLGSKVVNAAVVVGILLVAFAAFRFAADNRDIATALLPLLNSGDKDKIEVARSAIQAFTTTGSGIFGSFTTLVGTAITAFFGISAASGATKSAIGTAADAAKQQGAAEQTAATLQNKVAFVKKTLAAPTSADPSTHAATIDELRAYLA